MALTRCIDGKRGTRVPPSAAQTLSSPEQFQGIAVPCTAGSCSGDSVIHGAEVEVARWAQRSTVHRAVESLHRRRAAGWLTGWLTDGPVGSVTTVFELDLGCRRCSVGAEVSQCWQRTALVRSDRRWLPKATNRCGSGMAQIGGKEIISRVRARTFPSMIFQQDLRPIKPLLAPLASIYPPQQQQQQQPCRAVTTSGSLQVDRPSFRSASHDLAPKQLRLCSSVSRCRAIQ